MTLGNASQIAATALLLSTLAALSGCASTPMPPRVATGAADLNESQRLHALFDESWEANMRRYPEWATYVGDHRYGDQLHDATPENEVAGYAATRRYLEVARTIKREALAAKDRVSLEIFIHLLQQDLLFEPLVGFRRMTVNAAYWGGFQGELANLVQASPVAARAQVEQLIARLGAYPRRVDQELVRLREGLRLGWVPPRAVLQRAIASLDLEIAASGDASPFFQPFTKLGRDIPAAEQETLRERGRRAIVDQVIPAQRRLRDFVAGEYIAKAPANGALGSYPGGAAVYAAAVRQHTTTELSPAQIHATGLREVARLQDEIAKVMEEMKWQGDFASFVRHLNTEPSYFHTSPEELLTSYRDIAKRIDAELPRLFAELPRASYGVRAMPAHLGPERIESYDFPALDGSRPGWFNANTLAFKTRPKWRQEALTAHETVPGHHLQVARAIELGELPRFRRSAWFVAFGEGWALYAETLGFDLGLYKEAASRFGQLQFQIWRAARLAVDTGIHDQGWSRQRAIDYMIEQTGMDPGLIGSEVDRYTSVPGQALGYMIGQLKILELRDRARATLGDRFDIRRFHMVLLDQGAVPLTLLERRVGEWITEESTRR